MKRVLFKGFLLVGLLLLYSFNSVLAWAALVTLVLYVLIMRRSAGHADKSIVLDVRFGAGERPVTKGSS